jgi:carboxyl-terminal processing protease
VEEILKAHVCHKSLNQELMARIFRNFLEEMDPTKTYFLEGEVQAWWNPSEEILQKALDGYKVSNFSIFEKMHETFTEVISRRANLEAQVQKRGLVSGVKSEEFKELSWALDEEALLDRLVRIRSLQMESLGKIDEKDSMEKARLVLSYVLKAITSSLDAHTNYFTPSEANQFMIQVQQRLFGIGVQLRDDLDGLSIQRILENSPASQSHKIRINDKIIAVNGEPVVGLDITEAVELIRGEKNTPVVLTILRENKEDLETKIDKLEVELIRNEVVLEESRLETLLEPFGDGVIVHLRLFSFYQDPLSSSSLDIRRSLEQVKKEHLLKGVVLDLRSNAGGLLTQAVGVTGLFITKGIVVSIQDHTGKIQHLREVDGKPVWEGPLVVLINRASASAAEIVAQTLQDYGRGIVLGDDHSYGKGSFQTFTLDPINQDKVNPQGEYKVTRGRYYTVSGKSPQLEGVLSDIVIPGLLSQLDIGEKYAKFPLENNRIEEHFQDDLSDISPLHRIQLGPMYRYNLQKKLDTYQPYLEILKRNSKARIASNKNYQSFLSEIEKKNFDSDSVNLFGQNDLQLNEAMNVIKDLVFLLQNKKENTLSFSQEEGSFLQAQ